MKRHKPSYSEVLTSAPIHKCFVAYEVLYTHASSHTDSMAIKYLKSVAAAFLWDYDTFIDIIDEEYSTIYSK